MSSHRREWQSENKTTAFIIQHKESSSLLKLDWKSPLSSPVVIMFYASHYIVWQKQPVSFRNAIIHPPHVFCRFCYATSQTLIDPTLQRSMGTTVANCSGILRYGRSIRLCSTVARIIHKRWLHKHSCVSLCVPVFYHTVGTQTWHSLTVCRSEFCAFFWIKVEPKTPIVFLVAQSWCVTPYHSSWS